MTGFDEFIKLFGNVTLLSIIEIILAIVFVFVVYSKWKKHVKDAQARKDKEDAEKAEERKQIQEALSAVRKYPEYRQQSIDIQNKLESEIQSLREMQQDTKRHLEQMEEETKRRERNKLRDRLLQSYRYYTNPETNPSHSWTRMEAEAFWELFRDYEDMGGNGYVHSEVQPAMERLTIVEMNISKNLG